MVVDQLQQQEGNIDPSNPRLLLDPPGFNFTLCSNTATQYTILCTSNDIPSKKLSKSARFKDSVSFKY